ncbi:hypothetical protein PVA17_18760 [Lysinibacillus sp. CNPSo 3705]|uniref:hypothetical protein n=1 Tax=Lysinibacillus sp. CNPSo 3705 TaxID=3028148 RepID=UPI002363BC33|nr:hypothetical protein [Lysinibacillus sp. CNPSo 3705]MDD1504788.1 hypothetical protein [Lysinibacillus sp. CNPSo 3705]
MVNVQQNRLTVINKRYEHVWKWLYPRYCNVLSIGITTRYIHLHAGILHRDTYDKDSGLMNKIIF